MRSQRGFTLLEMLAAIALLVIASSVVLGAFGQSARALRQVERSDRLDSTARSLMDDLDLGELGPGTRHGDWDGLSWVLQVAAQQSESNRLTLYRLDLTLDDGTSQSHYSTLRLRAAGAGAAR